MNIEVIEKQLQGGGVPPGKLGEYQSILSGTYSNLCGQLEVLIPRKMDYWNKHRPEFKSDRACDMAYNQTEDGLQEQLIELRLKRVGKCLGAVNALLRIADGESRGVY